METKPTWHHFAPALLGVGAVLVAANAYERPERIAPWAAAGGLLAGMALALVFASRGSLENAKRRRFAESVRSGIVFGGLILVFTLSMTLSKALGAGETNNTSERVTMAIVGAFLVFTGNAIPKTLSPMPADAAYAGSVQALQRLAGWTWVLTGLAYALGWLVLPRTLAEPMTFVLLPTAMLFILFQLFRLRRAKQRPA
ncbi:MAG TPA: hypothetical protein VMV61_02500 [Patescibacteria group bacterium]|nr:hypothetical protein [Patescibacteria group bacterium]